MKSAKTTCKSELGDVLWTYLAHVGLDIGTEATAFASQKDKCGSSSFNLLPMVCGSFSFIEKYAII